MIPQYAFAGDFTGQIPYSKNDTMIDFSPFEVEAIEKGVNDVGKFDAGQFSAACESREICSRILFVDDWFVIAITVGWF